MTKLSININKIATLRNSRGGNMPCLTDVAMDVQRFGGEGITIHPRPDQRHIRFQDVYDLKPLITTEYNIEGYPSEAFIQMVLTLTATTAAGDVVVAATWYGYAFLVLSLFIVALMAVRHGMFGPRRLR